MITTGIFIASWTLFFLVSDKKRIPELFPTAIFSAFLGIFTDLIMEQYQLWSYQDAPLSPDGIKLILDSSIYPVVAFLFMQYLPTSFINKLVYIAVWVAASILLEIIYLKYQLIQHHMWWNLWMSFVADWFIYGLFILQYHFYARPKLRSDRVC